MRVRLAGERVNETHLIGQLAKLRHQLGNHFARLPARFELPWAPGEIALCPLKCFQPLCARHRQAIALDQFRLVVERVELTARARAENHENILRCRSEVRWPSRERLGRIDRRRGRASLRQQSLARQKTGQGYTAQPLTGTAQKLTTI